MKQPPCPLLLQGLQFQELFKSLFDAINGDKSGRQQLYGILLRLFFYEELPGDLILQLVPLLQASAMAARRALQDAVLLVCVPVQEAI